MHDKLYTVKEDVRMHRVGYRLDKFVFSEKVCKNWCMKNVVIEGNTKSKCDVNTSVIDR